MYAPPEARARATNACAIQDFLVVTVRNSARVLRVAVGTDSARWTERANAIRVGVSKTAPNQMLIGTAPLIRLATYRRRAGFLAYLALPIPWVMALIRPEILSPAPSSSWSIPLQNRQASFWNV